MVVLKLVCESEKKQTWMHEHSMIPKHNPLSIIKSDHMMERRCFAQQQYLELKKRHEKERIRKHRYGGHLLSYLGQRA